MSEPISVQCPKCLRCVGDPPGMICVECRAIASAIDDDECPDDDFNPDAMHCEICRSEVTNYGNNQFQECSICHMSGCNVCLRRGDDVFPWLCWECGG